MTRVALLFVLTAFELWNYASAAHQIQTVSSLGEIRNVVALLQGISRKVKAERDEENALYQDIQSFCTDRPARTSKARTGVARVVEAPHMDAAESHAELKASSDAASTEAPSSDADLMASSSSVAASAADSMVGSVASSMPTSTAEADDKEIDILDSGIDEANAAAQLVAQEVGEPVQALEAVTPETQQAAQEETVVQSAAAPEQPAPVVQSVADSAAKKLSAAAAIREALGDLATGDDSNIAGTEGPATMAAPKVLAKPQRASARPAEAKAKAQVARPAEAKAAPQKAQPQQVRSMIAHPTAQTQKVQAKPDVTKAQEAHGASPAKQSFTVSGAEAVVMDDAEKELHQMQAILGSNEEILDSEYHDVKVKPSSEHKAMAKLLRHATTKPMPSAQKPTPARSVISQNPLPHSVAKAAVSKATVKPMSTQLPKAAKKQPMQQPLKSSGAVTKDIEKELDQMNNLLDFAPEPAPAKAPVAVVAVPLPVFAKVPVVARKDDKDGAAVLKESDDLESFMDKEESDLKSEAAPAQAQLKKQLKAAVSQNDMTDKVRPEEKVDDPNFDRGFVDFDAQASSIVTLSGKHKVAGPVPTKKDDAESDVAKVVEKELVPMQDAPATSQTVAQVSHNAAATKPVAVEMPSTLAAPQEKALDDLAGNEALSDLAGDGTIPNIEKEALQLYNSFGGPPSSLEAVGGLSVVPSFLQVAEGKHTAGVPSQAELDAAWDALRLVAEQTRGAMSMIQQRKDDAVATKPKPLGLIQEQGLSEHEIDDECEWLINHFQHRQKVRAQETEMLNEAHKLLGSAHVYLQSHHHGHHHGARRLRGGQ